MEESTLRELYTAVRRGLRDGFTGTTSGAGSTTTLVASSFAYGSDNAWKASEIVLFEPQSPTDANPVRVTGFAASTGTFTFTPAITSTIAGIDFIIGHKDGRRWSHDEVLDQLGNAVRRVGGAVFATDDTTVTTVAGQYIYDLPTDWVKLSGVDYLERGGNDDNWRAVSNAYLDRRFLADGQFGLRLDWGGGQQLRLRGVTRPSLPTGWNDTVSGDAAVLRDDALYELLMISTEGADRQRAMAMQGGVMRARMGATLMGL